MTVIHSTEVPSLIKGLAEMLDKIALEIMESSATVDEKHDLISGVQISHIMVRTVGKQLVPGMLEGSK